MKAHQTFFMDCHLAGRKYYDADLVWDYLRVGQTLRLERDMQNPPSRAATTSSWPPSWRWAGPTSSTAASTASPPTPIPKTRCTSPSASAATGAQASCLSNVCLWEQISIFTLSICVEKKAENRIGYTLVKSSAQTGATVFSVSLLV